MNKDFNHANLPDPVADRLKELQDEINKLKVELEDHKQRKEYKHHDYSNL